MHNIKHNPVGEDVFIIMTDILRIYSCAIFIRQRREEEEVSVIELLSVQGAVSP